MKFADLVPGDTFNTKTYRATKISNTEAFIIESSIYDVFDLILVVGNPDVIPVSTSKQSKQLTELVERLLELEEVTYIDGKLCWSGSGDEV